MVKSFRKIDGLLDASEELVDLIRALNGAWGFNLEGGLKDKAIENDGNQKATLFQNKDGVGLQYFNGNGEKYTIIIKKSEH
jgi:hypothetical protein